MIPLNEKTSQDFLSVDNMKELSEQGVDLSDAKYVIVKRIKGDDMYIVYRRDGGWKNYVSTPELFEEVIPTYTLPELLYKLPEWLLKDEYNGLSFFKDAPFYAFYYDHNDAEKQDDSTFAMEYPIDSAFTLLLWCIKHGHGYSRDISRK